MSIVKDTLSRQWLMLRSIPRQGGVTAGDLTARLRTEGFEVSKRTIERDLLALSASFPLQVVDEETKPYRWVWAKGAVAMDIPGMSVTEALAFQLAKDALHLRFPAHLIDLLEPYFAQAGKVLTAVGDNNALSRWQEKVATILPTQQLGSPTCDHEVVAAIHEALLNERQLSVRYRARGRKEASDLVLHPCALVVRGTVTYLVATVGEYTDIRMFAVHRFDEAVVLAQARQLVDQFDLRAYVDSGAFGFSQKGEIAVVLKFTSAVAEHLKESPLAANQAMSEVCDGHVVVSATVTDTEQLRWWLLGFGDEVEVLEPAELRAAMKAIVCNMARVYEAHGAAAIQQAM